MPPAGQTIGKTPGPEVDCDDKITAQAETIEIKKTKTTATHAQMGWDGWVVCDGEVIWFMGVFRAHCVTNQIKKQEK